MRLARLFLLPVSTLLLALGCSGTKGSGPAPAPTPAYVGTVASIVTAPNADSADPADVDALNLQGLDSADDDTVFNAVLGN